MTASQPLQSAAKNRQDKAGVGLKLTRSPAGQIQAQVDGKSVGVNVHRCFPWSDEPGHFVSLRDKDGNEIAMIHDVAELDGESRRLIEQALAEAGFLLEIERIESLDEEFEIRSWRVVTRQGRCRFQSRMGGWPQYTPQGGMLIRDVANNLYYIPRPRELDEKSREILWAFID